MVRPEWFIWWWLAAVVVLSGLIAIMRGGKLKFEVGTAANGTSPDDQSAAKKVSICFIFLSLRSVKSGAGVTGCCCCC